MAATATAKQGGATGQQVQLKPFRQGTQPTTRSTGGVFKITPGASAIPIQTFQLPPSNLLRQIVIEVTGTTAANAAAVAFQPDMPAGVLSTVNFALSNGTAIVGGSNFSSYSLVQALKYFGFSGYGDPRASAVYSVTTGSVATGGSFNVVFRVPVEVVARSGLGCLPNTSTQTPFTLDLSVAPLASIYATAPTTPPSVSITISVNGYWNGGNAAYSPTPQQFGTTNYVNAATIQGLSGNTQIALPNVGLGYPVRNIMFINRLASSGARDQADWPAPFQLTYRGQNWKQYDSVNLWQDEMSQLYGLGGAIDTADGLDTGVFNVTNIQDFDSRPGNELGAYLNTQVGDELELLGSFGATCNVTEVVNFLAVPGSPMAVQVNG